MSENVTTEDAIRMSVAATLGEPFPTSVADTRENRDYFDALIKELDDVPEGATIYIPNEWAEVGKYEQFIADSQGGEDWAEKSMAGTFEPGAGEPFPINETDEGVFSAAITTFIQSNLAEEFTIADLRAAAPSTSDAMIKKVLRDLQREGIISPALSRGRAARYRRLKHDT